MFLRPPLVAVVFFFSQKTGFSFFLLQRGNRIYPVNETSVFSQKTPPRLLDFEVFFYGKVLLRKPNFFEVTSSLFLLEKIQSSFLLFQLLGPYRASVAGAFLLARTHGTPLELFFFSSAERQ